MVGHLDVEKHDVDLMIFQDIHGFDSIGAGGHQLQRLHLRHIVLQKLLCQILVINDDYIVFFFCVHISILTLYIPLSC